MHLIRFGLPTMRLGIVLALVASMALIAVACGGDDEDEATPEATVESTPIPTATPYARVPAPTIVASTTAQPEGTTSAPADVEYVVEPETRSPPSPSASTARSRRSCSATTSTTRH